MKRDKMSDQEFDDILRYALDDDKESLEHKIKRVVIDKVKSDIGKERFADKAIIEAVNNAYDLIDKEKKFYMPTLQEEIEGIYLTVMERLLTKNEYNRLLIKINEELFELLTRDKEGKSC